MASFRVYGTPIPQGSMKGFVSRGPKPRAILTSSNTKTEPWRQEIAVAAIQAKVPHLDSGPISCAIVFHLARPKSRPKKTTHPDVRPDIDKLTRAVLDALTSIAWRDDAQVCELSVRKVYSPTFVGADITVFKL